MINRDKIMPKDQFYKLGYTDRRALMSHWRLIHSTAEIRKAMGLSNTAFYALLKRLDLPTNMNEWKDSQPSLLGESKVESPLKQYVEPVVEDVTFGIEITGTVKQSDITKLIELAKNNDLEIKMKG